MREKIRSLLPGSIVVRTTLSIIALALLIGLAFAAASGWLVQGHEKRRLMIELEEQLSVVQQALSIACFVQDSTLAGEIGAGLLENHAVVAVRIRAGGHALFESTADLDKQLARSETLSIQRTIHSPFADDEAIGEVVLATSKSVLKADAWAYTRYVMLALALEVALVALAVAWVVYNLITRPIKGISDELHHLELRTGMHLRVPPRNREDEIGRLVNDVNALISRLSDLVGTERRLRLEREAGERRLAMVFDKVNAGLFTLDREGALQAWNPAFEQLLATPAPQQALQQLLPPRAAQRVQDLIDESRRSGGICEADLELPVTDGSSRWLELVLTPLDDGSLQGLLNDVSERKHAELAAQTLAERDTLTGLLNRRGFDTALAKVFGQRRRASDPSIALMMIDLDHFKQANDTYGHAAGDEVLRRVATILEAAVRRSDLIARQGGDEFVVALVGFEQPSQVERIATTIIERISMPMQLDGGIEVRVGASIGVALAADDETAAAPALERADRVMYTVKQTGRGRVLIAPPPAAGGV